MAMINESPFANALVELPYGFEKGKIFRSVMPGSKGQPPNLEKDLTALKTRDISHIILLTSDQEAYFGTNGACKSLSERYQEEGFTVTQFPIVDHGVPDNTELSGLLTHIKEEAAQGKKVAVHCVGGNGRTGLVTACLARKVFNISGDEAVKWVRKFIPNAVESKSQEGFVATFVEEEGCTVFEKSLTHLPFPFEKGNVYRCIMPGYNRVKPDIKADIEVLKSKNISHLVLLAFDKECEMVSGLNLKEEYEKAGIQVIHFPIKDGTAPSKEELSPILEEMKKLLSLGHHLAVHCMGGNGRTGIILSCLAAEAFKLPGDEAIAWVREYVPHAIETGSQKKLIAEMAEEKGDSLFKKSLTLLPFDFKKGAIYRSVMPGYYSSKENIKQRVMRDILSLKAQNITQVVMLATDAECLKLEGVDLKEEYGKHGIGLLHFPIEDGKIPDMKELRCIMKETMEKVTAGKRVAIHCSGGAGRTGLFAACMAQAALKLGGAESIKWIRSIVPGAVRTEAQEKFVLGFIKNSVM